MGGEGEWGRVEAEAEAEARRLGLRSEPIGMDRWGGEEEGQGRGCRVGQVWGGRGSKAREMGKADLWMRQ